MSLGLQRASLAGRETPGRRVALSLFFLGEMLVSLFVGVAISFPRAAPPVRGRLLCVVQMREAMMDMLELAYLRRAAYALFGALLLYPEGAILTDASEAARDLRREVDWTAELAFSGPWDRFLDAVGSLSADRLDELQESYLDLFGISAPAKPVPLCEASYLDPTASSSGLLLADLEMEYASAGLSVSTSSGETPDHAAVELEFVAFLCGKQGEALEAGDVIGALDSIERQRRFLVEHPCRWFPSLDRAVAARDRSDIYALTIQGARALAVHDADILPVWADHLEEEHG